MAKKDVEKLISLICQGGQIAVKDGFLMVTPPAIAARFADRIRELKPQILLALGHCPVCVQELVVEVGQISINGWPEKTKFGSHSYCPAAFGHYDKWKF